MSSIEKTFFLKEKNPKNLKLNKFEKKSIDFFFSVSTFNLETKLSPSPKIEELRSHSHSTMKFSSSIIDHILLLCIKIMWKLMLLIMMCKVAAEVMLNKMFYLMLSLVMMVRMLVKMMVMMTMLMILMMNKIF